MNITDLLEVFSSLSKEQKISALQNFMKECVERDCDEYLENILNIANELAQDDYFGTEALEGCL